MNRYSLSVNPACRADKPMRNILGMNNSPKIGFKPRVENQKKWFRELNLRHVRYHDPSYEDSGLVLIDVHRIFPLFHLDENDPRNYFFEQTDDYLAMIADQDIEIDFRLGESIDHSGYGRLIQPPPDPEKWARICKNIVAHYRDGAMNGMYLNITRATVWEEPDNPALFGGTVEQYTELYIQVYRLFKREFPGIQVGGPTIMGNGFPFLERFLTILKEQGIVPDYATFTSYARDLNDLPQLVCKVRGMLDDFGFADTKIIVSEWHLGPHQWGEDGHFKIRENGFDSSQSAAYSASTLIRLMDIPSLDIAFFYAWSTGVWVVVTVGGEKMARYPVYFGLKYFNALAATCEERLAVDCELPENVDVLAGRTGDGKVRLLISCYDAEASAFTCRVDGAASCRLLAVRSEFNETEADIAAVVPVNPDGSFTVAQQQSGSDVFLLEFDMN